MDQEKNSKNVVNNIASCGFPVIPEQQFLEAKDRKSLILSIIKAFLIETTKNANFDQKNPLKLILGRF